MSKFIASKQSHQVTQVHQYLRSFSFASPKENEPKEKATQKNAAQHTCLGSPAFWEATLMSPFQLGGTL
jgi:hypothetical protein